MDFDKDQESENERLIIPDLGDVEMERFPLLDLPTDVLLILPCYLEGIGELIHLMSCCRFLKSLYATISPHLIYNLAASSPTLFFPSPTPHLLLSYTAPQLTTWALSSHSNLHTIHNSFTPHGISGLLTLSLSLCRITIPELRTLKFFSINILTPLSHTVSQECGPLSTSALARAEQEDDEEYDMICEDPSLSLLQFALFGGLFQPDIRAVYEGKRATRLGWRIRRDWWAYCVPDVNCERVSVPRYYIEGEESENAIAKGSLELNMLSIWELLRSEFWCSAWKGILETPILKLNIPADDPRNAIYKQSLQGLGLPGLTLLLPPSDPNHGLKDLKLKREIEGIKSKVLKLDTQNLQPIDDLEGEERWEFRVSADSDVVVCLGWA